MNKSTNYLIVSLAVADLLVATLVMPWVVYLEVRRGAEAVSVTHTHARVRAHTQTHKCLCAYAHVYKFKDISSSNPIYNQIQRLTHRSITSKDCGRHGSNKNTGSEAPPTFVSVILCGSSLLLWFSPVAVVLRKYWALANTLGSHAPAFVMMF